MRTFPSLVAFLSAGLIATACYAATDTGLDLQKLKFQGHHYEVARIDLDKADLRLLWKKPDGERFKDLAEAARWLKDKGETVSFATNAGIYSPTYSPMGLHVEHGQPLVPLNLEEGKGNFFLKPNGVFYVGPDGAHVTPADRFTADVKTLTLATQSGPLLLDDGKEHPAFDPKSKHRNVRTGVGVKTPKEIVFVMSLDTVTFHEMAMFFRDALACPNALYLDGIISKFYPKNHSPVPIKVEFAGILVVTARDDKK